MKSTPQKLHVYEALHSLNQGFEQVLTDLRRLQEFPFLHRQFLRQFQVVVEETRAWANFHVVDFMQGRELDDWTKFGRLRHQWEKRYLELNDGPTVTRGLKRKRANPTGKHRAQGSKGARHV